MMGASVHLGVLTFVTDEGIGAAEQRMAHWQPLGGTDLDETEESALGRCSTP
jgi:hypothetical protein